jgi:Zn-dependent protease with chaperone function
MSDSLPEDPRLEGISARAFEHPADRAATAALQSIPMLDVVVKKLIEFGYERAFRQSFLAGSVRLGPNQLPQAHASHRAAFARLDMDEVPDLYLTQFPIANAAAIGSSKPMVVVNSRTVELLDELELRTVLAHEAGHILADHVKYRTALLILLRMSGVGRLGVIAGLPLMGVKLALLEWFRAAELSCDRAATLVNRDPLVTCRTLMVLAGGASSRKLNLDEFINQAREYEEWDSGWDKLNRLMTEVNLTHAYPVRRVREVMTWVQSGEYDRIAGGDYVRRGQEPGARQEASDAVEFYAERFRKGFKEAGDSIAGAGQSLAGATEKAGSTLADASERFADWLRSASTKPRDDDDDENPDARPSGDPRDPRLDD